MSRWWRGPLLQCGGPRFLSREVAIRANRLLVLVIGTSRPPKENSMSEYRTLTASQAARKGYHVAVWTAAELHEILLKAGRDVTVFESFGHVRGEERFGTHTLRAAEDAVEVLACTTGQVVLRYPLAAGPGKAKPGRMLVKK